jgi:hypothetical protein
MQRRSTARKKGTSSSASATKDISDLAIGQAGHVAKSKRKSLPGRQLGQSVPDLGCR